MLLHDNMNQCQMKVEKEEGGRNMVGGGGERGESRMHLILPAVLPISILSTEKTHQAARRECKQRTRDRQQGISNVNLLWPSEYILNA